MFRDLLASRHRRRCLIATLVITLGTVLAYLPWAQHTVPGASLLMLLEMKLIDWRFQQRGQRPPPSDVVVAAIDEDTIRRHGRWPWPRRKMAEVIRKLKQAKARAIVFDIFYTERDVSSADGPESDAELIEATRRAGNCFHAWFGQTEGTVRTATEAEAMDAMAERLWPVRVEASRGHRLLEYSSVTPPLPEVTQASKGIGYADLRDSGDGVFRFYDLMATHEGCTYPSLALSVVASDLQIEPTEIVVVPGFEMQLGEHARIPLIADGAMLLNFYGPDRTIPRVSVDDILAERLDPGAVAGKIVVLGATAKGVYELRPAPFGAVFYGVEIQATAIANLIEGRGFRSSDLIVDILVTLALGLSGGLGLTLWRPAAGSILSLGLFLGYNSLCAVAFSRASYLLPMAAPNVALVACALAILAYRLSTEEWRRNRITQTFGLFVPPEVVQQLTAEDASLDRLEAQRREVTVLFSDIRNFTTYAEGREAEDVVALLNRYFSLMHGVIWRFGGTVDKYMGDGLMAFFGAPTYQEDHPERAILAAIEMQRQIALHQEEWAAFGMESLRAGIGVHTGEALVGYAGSEGRMQYTCIGHVVNLASRLEELTREHDAQILVSEDLYQRVEGTIEAQPIGRARIRGLLTEVLAYAVTGKRDGTRPDAERPGQENTG
jgi:adenylate cyclase